MYFFNVVPSSVDTSFNHLLWSVFQSSLHTNYMLQFIIDLCVHLQCTAKLQEMTNDNNQGTFWTLVTKLVGNLCWELDS